jgi:hypothetical protein
MGGHGSGRYCRWSNTITIEEVKRIDIRYFRRQGVLRPNCAGSLNWTCGGEPAGDIRYSCYADRIVFNYHYRSSGSDWEPVEVTTYFDRTPCHIGGERLWFRCSACHRRCEVLCLNGKYPACRKCYRLPYRSQCEDRRGRLQRRQEKLEAQLWGDRRKWWRRAKRERLLAELELVAVAADEAFFLAATNLLSKDGIFKIFNMS